MAASCLQGLGRIVTGPAVAYVTTTENEQKQYNVEISQSSTNTYTLRLTDYANYNSLVFTTEDDGTVIFKYGQRLYGQDIDIQFILASMNWDGRWYISDRDIYGTSDQSGTITINPWAFTYYHYVQVNSRVFGAGANYGGDTFIAAQKTVITPRAKSGDLSINPTSLHFTAEGGKQTVKVSCFEGTENWRSKKEADWITLKPNGSAYPSQTDLVVTAAPNISEQERQTIITIYPQYHTDVTVSLTVTQDGKKIENKEAAIGGLRYFLDYSTMTAKVLSIESDESGKGEVVIPAEIEEPATTRDTRAGTTKNFRVKAIGDSIMTRMALNMRSLNCISFPSSIETVSEKAFDGAKTKSLVWQSDTEMPENAFHSLIDDKLVNMLVYVNKASLAPSSVTNKIVKQSADGTYHIDSLELVEDNEFYCPQKFEAGKVTFKHSFNMTTGIQSNGDGAQGWESIVLPFNVETVSYKKDGHTYNLVPFDRYAKGHDDNDRPFWLYEWDGTAFKSADRMEANKPYLISMPNNSEYAADYCISGNVVFSARNEEVKETDVEDAYTGIQPQKGFYATYAFLNNEIISGRNILCINSESKVSGHDHLAYDYSDYAIGDEPKPGSLFMSLALIKRDWGAYPFEGFMLSDSPNGTRETINIEFTAADSQGIEEIIQATPTEHFEKGIYTLSGQYIGNFKNSHSQLPKGIYIVDGKKKNVK